MYSFSLFIRFHLLLFYFRSPASDSPGQNQSYGHQQSRKHERRAGQMWRPPIAMRSDEACECQSEEPRPDHPRDSHYAAVRALKLPLFRRPDVTRHQSLRRGAEKSHEREDRQRAQEDDSRRRQPEDRVPGAAAKKSREKRPPFAEARDYTLDESGLHNDCAYSDDSQRQPYRAFVPAVTKAGVEYEDAGQDLMGKEIDEVD